MTLHEEFMNLVFNRKNNKSFSFTYAVLKILKIDKAMTWILGKRSMRKPLKLRNKIETIAAIIFLQ